MSDGRLKYTGHLFMFVFLACYSISFKTLIGTLGFFIIFTSLEFFYYVMQSHLKGP